MKKTAILFLIVLITISILQLGCGSSDETDSSALEKGQNLIGDYKFEEADEVFREFSKSDSLSYTALFGSALVDEHRLKYIDALVKYMTIVESGSRIPSAYLGLYRMYRFFDMPNEAASVGYNYIEIIGASLESSRLEAEILLESNKSKRLRKEISTTSYFDSHQGEKNIIIAQTFQLENRNDSAQFYFEAGLENSENSPEFLLAASGFLQRAGLIDSAITLSAKAIELSNYDYLITVEHYFLLMKNNYFNQARVLVKKLSSLGIDEGTKQLFIYYNYFYQSKFNMSRYALNTFMRIGNSGYCNNFYDFRVGSKRDEGNEPGNIMKMILTNMTRAGYSPEIVNVANYIMFRHFSETKNNMTTLKIIDNLHGIYLTKEDTKIINIEQLYLTGQTVAAEREISSLSKPNSRNPGWLTSVGNIYKHDLIRKYDKAELHYKDALAVDEFYRPAFENYVQMFRKTGNYDRSLEIFKEYPQFENNYPDLKILKALCIVETGDMTRGLKLFEQSLNYKTEDLSVFNELIYTARIQKNDPAIEKILNLLVSSNENNADALTYASEKYIILNDFEKSQALSQKAFELDDQNNDAKVINAFANYKLGQVQSAEQTLNTIVSEDKYNSKANMFLAQLLGTEGKDFSQASNLARKAVSFSQNGYDEWMTLCFVYFQMGRYDLCRGEALKSSRKYKKLPIPYYWLGLSQFEEDRDGARDNLVKAINLGLTGEKLKLANGVIKQL